MQRFIWASSYVAGGVAAGCISAFMLIQSAGIEPVQAGTPWFSRAAPGTDGESFYARARYLLEGRLPPAPGQMIEATAETDGDGRPLTSSCAYRIASAGPLPRWWSLSVATADGSAARLQSTADSDTAVREADGTVRIIAARQPEPGNWLKAPDQRRFTLLYSALPPAPPDAPPPFTITREGCP